MEQKNTPIELEFEFDAPKYVNFKNFDSNASGDQSASFEIEKNIKNFEPTIGSQVEPTSSNLLIKSYLLSTTVSSPAKTKNISNKTTNAKIMQPSTPQPKTKTSKLITKDKETNSSISARNSNSNAYNSTKINKNGGTPLSGKPLRIKLEKTSSPMLKKPYSPINIRRSLKLTIPNEFRLSKSCDNNIASNSFNKNIENCQNDSDIPNTPENTLNTPSKNQSPNSLLNNLKTFNSSLSIKSQIKQISIKENINDNKKESIIMLPPLVL